MITEKSPLGPNVKRLIYERAAQAQLEAARVKYGECGIEEMAQFLVDGGASGLKDNLWSAFQWVAKVLDILRKSSGSEQWPTDEDMAAEILRRIKNRKE